MRPYELALSKIFVWKIYCKTLNLSSTHFRGPLMVGCGALSIYERIWCMFMGMQLDAHSRSDFFVLGFYWKCVSSQTNEPRPLISSTRMNAASDPEWVWAGLQGPSPCTALPGGQRGQHPSDVTPHRQEHMGFISEGTHVVACRWNVSSRTEKL